MLHLKSNSAEVIFNLLFFTWLQLTGLLGDVGQTGSPSLERAGRGEPGDFALGERLLETDHRQ